MIQIEYLLGLKQAMEKAFKPIICGIIHDCCKQMTVCNLHPCSGLPSHPNLNHFAPTNRACPRKVTPGNLFHLNNFLTPSNILNALNSPLLLSLNLLLSIWNQWSGQSEEYLQTYSECTLMSRCLGSFWHDATEEPWQGVRKEGSLKSYKSLLILMQEMR